MGPKGSTESKDDDKGTGEGIRGIRYQSMYIYGTFKCAVHGHGLKGYHAKKSSLLQDQHKRKKKIVKFAGMFSGSVKQKVNGLSTVISTMYGEKGRSFNLKNTIPMLKNGSSSCCGDVFLEKGLVHFRK